MAPTRASELIGRVPAAAGSLARALTLVVFAGLFAFPLYWLATTAFKPSAEWQPPGRVVWWPQDPTLDNFRLLFDLDTNASFVEATFPSAVPPILNSLVAAGGGTVLALLVGLLAAYGTVRFRTGGRPFKLLLFATRGFPPIVFLIPVLFFFATVGLWDTRGGLILVYAGFTVPLAVWLMCSFLLRIPRELADAAIVDGCSHWGAFLKAVLPAARSGVAVTGLYVFIVNWSDLLIAQVLTQDRAETATVYLAGLQADEVTLYGPKAALGLLLLVPPLVIGLALSRSITSGLTFGALRR